jgi:putative sigma-54 modulation protein
MHMVAKNKFKEEDELGYRVDIVGRNIEITDPIRAYIFDKLAKIERFHNHIMHVHLTLEIQKVDHSCIIILKIDHTQVKCRADSSDMYASIDRAIDRLQSLLSRYKSRIQDHHKKKLSVIDMKVNVLHRPFSEVEDINAEIEEVNTEKRVAAYTPPKVIGNEVRPLKMLTTDEAVMKIELSGDNFLIFRNEEDQKLKVLYRRTDGHYGLIQPE